MSVLRLNINTGRPASMLVSQFETPGGKQAIARRILNFLEGVQTGTELASSDGNAPSIAVTVRDSEPQASGTLTLASAVATNTFTINGVTFTGVASGATGNQFNIGGSDTITAANIVSAINSSVTALVSGYVTASSVGAVVTILSSFYGLSGNQTTLTGTASTITASGARLANGALDPAAITLSF